MQQSNQSGIRSRLISKHCHTRTSKNISDKDKALLQEICFGVLRTLPQLEWIIQQLMDKPLKGKQRILHYLIMVGLYQLLYTRIPAHAALAETVDGAVALKNHS